MDDENSSPPHHPPIPSDDVVSTSFAAYTEVTKNSVVTFYIKLTELEKTVVC